MFILHTLLSRNWNVTILSSRLFILRLFSAKCDKKKKKKKLRFNSNISFRETQEVDGKVQE